MSDMRKILIVDDERINISVLADLLKPRYKIMAAINGKQALKAAQSENQPDLILLDVMMPEMDGYEVCALLKEDPATAGIPIIFVTAMGQESDETRGLSAGAVDYITKPISPAIVEARVETQMTLRQNMADLQTAYGVIEAQKERMQQELNFAKDIQLSMLPQQFPAFPDHTEFKLHASMQAAREVGGDFYDFFFVDEHHLCLCVGDVSGKGVPAALFMAISKAMIKSRAIGDLSTANILTHVNDVLAADNEAMMFVTVFIMLLDIRTGEFVFTNGGHNPPYLKRRDGTMERMDQIHGMVLGPMEGIAYKQGEGCLGRGDTILLYTDGVTEAMNPASDLYGEERLTRLLGMCEYSNPEDLINAMIGSIEEFAAGAEQSDDITLLTLTFHSTPSASIPKRLEMTMANRLQEVGTIMEAFGAFAEQNQIPSKTAGKVSLAFDELLNNIVSYGFPDGGDHEIEVLVECKGKHVLVTITDDGMPFNPFLMETPNTKAPLEEREIGGLGIHLVRELMDEFSYKRGVDRNIVTLKKRLNA